MVEAKDLKVTKLIGKTQNYDWGISGETSLVARLHYLNTGEPVDPKKPYAELWMGTHPNGPASLKPDGSNPTGPLIDLKSFLGKGTT